MADSYRLTVVSEAGNTFTVERPTNGSAENECTVAASGGCPAGGGWG